jgi:hypothetical protein
MTSGMAAPASPGGAYREEAYGGSYDDDMAPPSPDMAEMEMYDEGGDAGGDPSFGSDMSRAVNASPAPPPKPAPSADGEPQPEPAVSDPDQTASHGRQIVYTATMRVAVYNLEDGMKTAEAIPEKVGGWVHSRSEGVIVMKIPAAKLKSVMRDLGKLGNVEDKTLQAQDVTAEFVDLESRIRVLKETQTHLVKLLAKAKSVEEALHVRQALDQVTMELEVSLGRMRQLKNMIAFSTLTVNLVERGPNQPVPSENDPFPWVDSLGVEATEWR